jgi:hypothetical protein
MKEISRLKELGNFWIDLPLTDCLNGWVERARKRLIAGDQSLESGIISRLAAFDQFCDIHRILFYMIRHSSGDNDAFYLTYFQWIYSRHGKYI